MSELIQNLIAPVSEASPCGELAKYEPEYEAMDAELQKLNSVDGLPIKWSEISSNAATILSSKSKDIQVASYFAVARLEMSGLSGLIEGLMVIDSLIEQYWDDLYPAKKRIRARLQAMEWLNEQVLKRIDDLFNGAAPDDLKSLSGLFESIIKRFTEATDGAHVPEFGEISSKANSLLSQGERKQKEQDSKRKQAEAKKEQGIHEIEKDADVTIATKSIQQNYRNIAQYFFEKSLSDIRAYRYNRSAAWASITTLPQVKDGRSVLPPMQPVQRERLQAMMDKGQYVELVKAVETQIPSAPYYLDLQRFSFDALMALGETHILAAEEVRKELAGFLGRFPELMDLCFNDGTSIIDDLTRDWIGSEVIAVSGDTRSEATESQPWETGLHEAKLLAAKGKFNQGLAIFDAGRTNSTGDRESAHWTCAQASFCLNAGYPQSAVAQLEYVNSRLIDSELEKWDPQLAQQVSRLLLQCYDSLLENRPGNIPGLKNRVIEQFDRLSRIDTEFAIKMSDSKGLKPIILKMYEFK